MPTPILMPRQGQSVESCILNEWLVKPGDVVEVGQAVASIETDKATFEVEAPEAGVILALFFDEGEDIPVLTHIAAVGSEGEDVSGLAPGGAVGGNDEAPPVSEPASDPVELPAVETAAQPEITAIGAVGVSPRARAAAQAKGVDATAITGSGPGGRVIERDVLATAAQRPPLTGAARDAAAAGLSVPSAGSGPGGRILSSDLGSSVAGAASAPMPTLENKEIQIKGIRKIVAERMRSSLAGTAQLTMSCSVDARALLAFRARVKKCGAALGLPNITINDMIVYAAAQTLQRHPELNAHFLGDKILQFGTVNMGIAVDTPRGLMVPVLKRAESMSLRQISAGIKPLAEACMAGNPNPDDLGGGTFTITNLGSLGIETFTPVLNAPEVAILGVGGLSLKAIRTEQGVEHVDSISLSLTIDHQAVDGAPGARFLKDLTMALENFELLLA